MTRAWYIALALLAAAAVGALAGYEACREPRQVRQAAANRDAMLWLKSEFALTPRQASSIEALHSSYLAVCAGHCAHIQAAISRGAPPAEVAALEAECTRSMTAHFQAVAALMSPGQGRRYLAIVLPRIADYDHRGAPTIRGNP